ncbi:unnamed protein product [Linum tenue]|uniref:Uncharacterized protein n=1 Tax=Linum tenue TaxID=586396 RepID=A0AAV0MMH0_9ROSI|nr:unnamed protein product [Linum tenue]
MLKPPNSLFFPISRFFHLSSSPSLDYSITAGESPFIESPNSPLRSRMILELREKERILLLSSTSQSSRSTAGAPLGQSIERHQHPPVAVNLGFGRWISKA